MLISPGKSYTDGVGRRVDILYEEDHGLYKGLIHTSHGPTTTTFMAFFDNRGRRQDAIPFLYSIKAEYVDQAA